MAETFNEKTWSPLAILCEDIIRSLLLGVKRRRKKKSFRHQRKPDHAVQGYFLNRIPQR